MNFALYVFIFCVLLFFCILACFHAARIWGKNEMLKTGSEGNDSAILTGVVFSLLGLMVSFSFAGAYGRYEERRHVILQESNAIGTAYLRVDMLPEQSQPAIRDLFRKYAETRAQFYDALRETGKEPAINSFNKAVELQNAIWTASVQASGATKDTAPRMLLMPALNEMIDIVSTRNLAVQTHPPALVSVALSLLALLSAWFAGYNARKATRPLIYYSLAFSFAISFMMYVILDLEFPSHGFVNLRDANSLLVDLAKSMR